MKHNEQFPSKQRFYWIPISPLRFHWSPSPFPPHWIPISPLRFRFFLNQHVGVYVWPTEWIVRRLKIVHFSSFLCSPWLSAPYLSLASTQFYVSQWRDVYLGNMPILIWNFLRSSPSNIQDETHPSTERISVGNSIRMGPYPVYFGKTTTRDAFWIWVVPLILMLYHLWRLCFVGKLSQHCLKYFNVL